MLFLLNLNVDEPKARTCQWAMDRDVGITYILCAPMPEPHLMDT